MAWTLAQLQRCFLFVGMQTGEIESLLANAKVFERTFERGEKLDGDPELDHKLGILLEGEIEASQEHPDGKRIILNRLRPGEAIGVARLFEEQVPPVSSLRAIRAGALLLLTEGQLLQSFMNSQRMLQNYLTHLNRRIRFLNVRLACFSRDSGFARLESYLEALRKEAGGAYEIRLSMSKIELAAYLGISRAALYRDLELLCDSTGIQMTGSKVIFPSHDNH